MPAPPHIQEILDNLPTKPGVYLMKNANGEVIYVDSFGNLVTNLTPEELAQTFATHPDAHVWVGDNDVGIVRQTYGQVEPDQELALIGSVGNLEIAVNRGNAAERFDLGIGAHVSVR